MYQVSSVLVFSVAFLCVLVAFFPTHCACLSSRHGSERRRSHAERNLSGPEQSVSHPGMMPFDDSSTGPPTFVWKGPLLAQSRQRVRDHDPELMPAAEALRRSADSLLKVEDGWTVMSKNMTPPSGSKHDYESVAIYYWPCNSPRFQPAPSNCNMTTGLPWVSHDGVVDTEAVAQLDGSSNSHMTAAVSTLSIGYYFLGNETYAKKAVSLLNKWFLDSETAMNPNLQFAQIEPGHNNGSSGGIIDTAAWVRLVDSFQLLTQSESFSSDFQKDLMRWFGEYATWLLKSEHGQAESRAGNNHATWYDAQVLIYALFSGNKMATSDIASQAALERVKLQIQPDGQMPEEERRTKSESYCLYNLEAFMNLADLCQYYQVNLYNYTTSDGRSLQKAIDFMIPFATGQKEWPFKQIAPFRWSSFFEIFRRATYAYGGSRYEDAISKLPSLSSNDITQLLFPSEKKSPLQHASVGNGSSYIRVGPAILPSQFLTFL